MGRGLDGFCDSASAAPLCGFQGPRRAPVSPFSVAVARGIHLFPFRTEQLSLSAPMVLGPRGPGRVGRRRFWFSVPPRAGLGPARGEGGHPARRAALAAPPSHRPLRLHPPGYRGEARLRPGRNLAGTPRRPPGGRPAMWMLGPTRVRLGRRQAAQGGAQQRAGPARGGGGGALGEHASRRLANGPDGTLRARSQGALGGRRFRPCAGISFPGGLQAALQGRRPARRPGERSRAGARAVA
jgi:hypothetical protein